MFFLRRQSASHATLACTHIQTESKRGYIKQVSDLDDSLDVQVVGCVCGGGGASQLTVGAQLSGGDTFSHLLFCCMKKLVRISI